MNKRYDGILLCCDFDHTLSSCTHKWIEGGSIMDAVPKNNVTAINRFVSEGGTFVMVSGRNPDEIYSLKSEIAMEDMFVASNGTAVYSATEQKAVVSFPLDDGFVDVIRYLLKEEPAFAYFRITDNDFNFHHWYKGDDAEKVIKDAKYPAYKMIIQPATYEQSEVPAFKEKVVKKVVEKFSSRYKIDMSSDFTLEVCALGSGKGEAIKAMLPLMNKKFKKIVCVGDGQNDIGMLKFADVSYAVGNAVDEIKKIADFVTVTSDKGALEYIINEL